MNRASGKSTISSANLITRPDNITAYAAGDVITNATAICLTFPDCAKEKGDSGVITQVTIIDSIQAATPLTGELWLFSATLTPADDNAAFAPTDAQALTCIGVIPFTSAGYLAANSVVVHISNFGGLTFQCAADNTSLYGVLVARNAYAPTALETFQVKLHIIYDTDN